MTTRVERGDAESAVDVEALAASMYRAFVLAGTGVAPPAADAEGDRLDEGWLQAAAAARAMLDDASDGELVIRWEDFASLLCKAWGRAHGRHPEWDEIPRPTRLSWEAAARHAANLVAGGRDALADLDAHERHWADFAARNADNQPPKAG